MWHYWIHPGWHREKLCPGLPGTATWRWDALWLTLPNLWWNLTLRENLDQLSHKALFTVHLFREYLAISYLSLARRLSDAIQYQNLWQRRNSHSWLEKSDDIHQNFIHGELEVGTKQCVFNIWAVSTQYLGEGCRGPGLLLQNSRGQFLEQTPEYTMSSAPWSYAIQRYWGDPQMAYSGYKCDPKTTFWQRWVSWRPFVYGPQEFTESKTMKGGYFFASLEGNQAEEGKHLVFVGVQHQVVRDSSRICCEYGMGLCPLIT